MGFGQKKWDEISSAVEPLEILLVEDNPADADLVSELMKDEGFPGLVHWVSDGAEALDYLLRRGKFASARMPDVVLLDLNMPKVDGREVLKEFGRHPELRSVPVVVLTTSNRPEDILKCHEFLVGAYLVKPRDLGSAEKTGIRASASRITTRARVTRSSITIFFRRNYCGKRDTKRPKSTR